MAIRTLDITHLSAHDLKKTHHFKHINVYAIVSISGGGDGACDQALRTPVDPEGDDNPRWNGEQIQFKLSEAALQANRLTLDFKLLCEHTAGDEAIAELSVPVKELLLNPAAGKDHAVARDLRRPGGLPKGGRITFSCKFGTPPPAAEEFGFVKGAIGFGFGLGKAVVGAVASEVTKIVAPGPAGPGPTGSGSAGVVGKKRAVDKAKNNAKGKANGAKTSYPLRK